LPDNDDLVALIDAMNLKDILGEINTNGLNLHLDAPFKRIRLQPSPKGTEDAEARPPLHHQL